MINIGKHESEYWISIKKIRSKRSLSLDDVAKATNVSKAQLAQIEKGKQTLLSQLFGKLRLVYAFHFLLYYNRLKNNLKNTKVILLHMLLKMTENIVCTPSFHMIPKEVGNFTKLRWTLVLCIKAMHIQKV